MELDNQAENQAGGTPQSSEEMLRVVTQELQSLKENLLSQLSQELSEMRAERSRLGEEIEQMRSQQSQQWQSQPPQSDQQQIWAQQLAQILASHLQERLKQQLSQSAAEMPSSSENAYKLMSSVDSTLSSTLKSLQQDVSSYQSAIAQQLGRMQSMEQQGEAILEALVSRLKYQLQDVAVQRATVTIHPQPQPTMQRSAEVAVSTPPPPSPPPPAALPAVVPPAVAIAPPALNTGFFLILMSFVILSLQNIVTKIILTKKPVFLLGNLGGFVQPTGGNILLILLMRMLIELPLIFFVARILYPRAWREIRQLFNSSRRNFLRWLLGSGTALFVSQFCFYMAMGNLPTGVTTALFFIYPTVVILCDWQLLGTRPTLSLSLATISIYLGAFLVIPFGQRLKEGNLWLGVATAVTAGIALAIYVLLTRICAQKLKLHPLPFRIVDCTTILALSTLSIEVAKFFPLKFWQYNVPDRMWNTLWIWAGILALSTLVSLLLNHFGFRQMGGTFAPLLGASVPMLTTLMAWAFLRENLQPMQAIGIAIVTMWVLGISAENMKQMAAKRAAAGR